MKKKINLLHFLTLVAFILTSFMFVGGFNSLSTKSYAEGETYMVSFDANGGTGTISPQKFEVGVGETLTPNAFTYTGYTFAGWSETSASVVKYADKASYTIGATDVTLYAVWKTTINSVDYTLLSFSEIVVQDIAGVDTLTKINHPNGSDNIIIESSYSGMIGETPTTYNIQEIGDGTNFIYNSVESVCTDRMTNVALAEGIVKINAHAFEFNNVMASIILPTTLTEIGSHAFEVSGIVEIVLPESVTTIGDMAFSDCESLTTITLLAITPPTISNLFGDTSSSKIEHIYVPSESYDAYIESNWHQYLTKIKSFEVVEDEPSTITYYLYGGVVDGTNPTTYTSLDTITLINPTREGYDFEGWSDADLDLNNFLPSVTIPAGGGEDKSYYANWSKTIDGIKYILLRADQLVVNLISGTTTDVYVDKINNYNIPNIAIDSLYFGQVYNPEIDEYVYGVYNIKNIGNNSNSYPYDNAKVYNTSSGYTVSNILFGEGITKIQSSAFYNCLSLESVILPSSLTHIEFQAFSLEYDNRNNTLLNTVKFMPNPSLISIGAQAFHCCVKLSYMNIEDCASLVTISRYAFYECSLLPISNLVIRNTVQEIGERTFYKCALLSNVTFEANSSLTTIGSSAFSDSGLVQITIPKSVILIRGNAFYNCQNLTNVNFEANSSLTTIEYDAFSKCENLVSFTLPKSVTSIGNYAFSACIGLTSFIFEEGSELTTIPETFLSNCSSLTSIILPDSITTIGTYAFASSGITQLAIPSGVLTLGSRIFYNYNHPDTFNSLTVWANTPPTLLLEYQYGEGPYDIFYTSGIGTDKGNIYVPSVSVDAYKEAPGWSTYASQISAITDLDFVLSFNANGGSGEIADQTFTYGVAQNLTSNIFTREGYRFDGWSTTANGEVEYTDGKSYDIANHDVTFYAVWSNTYTITYNLNGGSVKGENPTTYLLGFSEPITLIKPTKTGYTFAGWTGTGLETPSQTVTIPTGSFGNREYTANWNAIPYTVSFIANGGVGEIADQTFTYGVGQNLTTNIFTREGYNFDGWSTTSGGAVEYADEEEFIIGEENVTLYAVWSNTYTITYDLNGGIVTGENPTTYLVGFTEPITLINPTREGYTFAGWVEPSNTSTLISTVTIEVGSSGNRSYKAHWAKEIDGIRYIYLSFSELVFEKIEGTDFDVRITSINPSIPTSHIVHPVQGYPLDSYNGYIDYAYYGVIDGVEATYYVKEIGDGINPFCIQEKNIEGIAFAEGIEKINGNAFFKNGRFALIFFPRSLKEIDDYAFYKCSRMFQVSFEENSSLTRIGKYAFSQCNNLTGIEIPNSVIEIDDYAFNLSSALKNVYFESNSSLERIGKYAFSQCNGLTGIEIPNSVIEIDDYAFDYLSQLKSITFESNSSLERIGKYTFGGYSPVTTITIPNSVIEIDDYAFYGAHPSLLNVYFESNSSLERIGKYAFSQCNGLTGIEIPNSVIEIDDYAFYYLSQLRSITFESNSSLERIGKHSFQGYNPITTITIPNSVIEIDDYAFGSEHPYLLNVYFESNSSLERIGKYAFGGYCPITTITIPNSVIEIDDYAFYYLSQLRSVTFESNSSLKRIGKYAFSTLRYLTEFTLPDSVVTIGDYAFDSCSNLYTITIPSSVTTLGTGIFLGCPKLVQITNLTGITLFPNDYTHTLGLEIRTSLETPFVNTLTNYDENGVKLFTVGEEIYFFAFNGNNGATELNLKDYNFTSIYYDGFAGSFDITTLTLPKTLENIGETGFKDCYSLETLTIWAINPSTFLDELELTDLSEVNIYVPSISLNSYKLAVGWSTYSSKIVAIADETFTVIFNANGGTGEDYEQNFIYGTPTALTANTFTRVGYDFAGWSTTAIVEDMEDVIADVASYTISDSDVTLYAVWTPKSYNLVFDATEGTGTMTDQIFKYGVEESLNLNTTITRAGYHFEGWATEAGGEVVYLDGALYTIGNGDATLYAVWENTFIISYELNGGEIGEGINPIQFTFTNDTFSLIAPTRENYTFIGWTSDGLEEPTLIVTFPIGSFGNRTYTANWQLVQHTITFVTGNGVTVPSITQDYDSTVTLPTPIKTGHTFEGWALIENGVVEYQGGESFTLTQNITLFGVWSVSKFIVTFVANDGEGGILEQEFTYDVAGELNQNTFTKLGHTFEGWSTTENGEVEFEDEDSFTIGDGNVNLYAVWSANQYTLSFNANGGEGEIDEQVCTYGVAEDLTANTFTRVGYIFAGWSTTETGEVEYADEASYLIIADDVTLYAVWTAEQFTITFVTNGGAQIQALTQDYDSIVTLPSPTRFGHTFNGWYLDEELTEEADISIMTNEDITLYASWTKDESNTSLYLFIGLGFLVLFVVFPITYFTIRKAKRKKHL